MTPPAKSTLVLGIANPLGVAAARELARKKNENIIMADLPGHMGFLKAFVSELGGRSTDIQIASISPSRPLLGLPSELVEQIAAQTTSIILLALERDRTMKASQLQKFNTSLLRGTLDLAYQAKKLKSLVVTTDVGLIGDYPGRFYESWMDVGQIPFDAVDRSSFDTETVCLREKSLPIIRARIGILSDLREDTRQKRCWLTAAQILLPSLKYLRILPKFVSIPSAISKDCLAPLTPTEWAAEAVIALTENQTAVGKAFHLVLEDAPSMNKVLETIGELAGGATIRGSLNVRVAETLGAIPGLRETARRQTDHVASWWTPHRYCLSRNELDTNQLSSLQISPSTVFYPTKAMHAFFRLV